MIINDISWYYTGWKKMLLYSLRDECHNIFIDIREGIDIYLQIQVIPDYVSLYFPQDVFFFFDQCIYLA